MNRKIEHIEERRKTPISMAPIEVREDNSSRLKRPRVSGYAAVYYRKGDTATEYSPDGFTERIERGAFDRALRENQDVVALFDHDTRHLLGRTGAGTLELESDERGLHYTISTADTTIARDVLANIRAGNLTGSSFAFVVRKEEWEELEDGTAIRTVKDVDLFDVGPVTKPAYDGTSTEAAAARGSLRLAKARARKAIDDVSL